MARQNRGSAGLALLWGCLFLLALGQIVLLFAQRSYSATLAYFRGYQLRLLAHSALVRAEEDQLDRSGSWEQELAQVTLQPGAREAKVVVAHTTEATASFHHWQARASLEQALAKEVVSEQVLQRFTVDFPENYRHLAATYGLVCGGSLNGAEYLPEETVYASNREVSYPQTDFWQGRATNYLTVEEIKDSGLVRQVYYLDGGGTFSIPARQKVWGSALLITATNTTLSLGAGSEFRDRVILICGAPLLIGDNVRLPQALIIGKRGVTIGKNCVINGLVAAGGSITIKGPCQLTRDETVVAPFSSVAFIAGGSDNF